jgi:hypothetical protein
VASLTAFVLNVRVQRVALMLIGAGAGYWYYATIGCERGCAITGDPWISTAYGALIGALVHPARFRSTPHQRSEGDGR